MLPDERPEALQQRYGLLVAHLAEELDQEIRLLIPDDYDDLVRRFGSGEVDIAYFGATTFVAAMTRHKAVPLVMREIDSRFTSYFVARAETPDIEIEQFGGRSFAFGSERSTSGHLMPRYFLNERGISPETFFGSVVYSGAHDATVNWIREGRAELGAVNAEVFDAMLLDGRIEPGLLRVVWETPPYSDYVWAIQPGWREAYVDRLRDAFLGLSVTDEAAADILQPMGTEGFLPASRREFRRLREIMASLPQFQPMTASGSN